MSKFLTKLDHLTILTDKLDLTIQFYTKVLDLEIADWRPNFPFAGAWLALEDNAIIHLVEVSKFYKNSGNIDHFALKGQNLTEFKKRLNQENIEFIEKTTPDNMFFQIFITDPNKIKVEVTFPKLQS